MATVGVKELTVQPDMSVFVLVGNGVAKRGKNNGEYSRRQACKRSLSPENNSLQTSNRQENMHRLASFSRTKSNVSLERGTAPSALPQTSA